MSDRIRRLEFRLGPLSRLLPYLKRYGRQLWIGVLTVLATNIAAVVAPWILREAVDYLKAGEVNQKTLIFYASFILLVSLVEGIFRFLMRRILIGVSRLIEYDLRNDLFAHLQLLSSSFYQRHSTGDIMARATNDLSAVRSVLGPGIMYSINTLFTTILTISVLFTISPRLAILTLIPLVAVSLSVKHFGHQIHQLFEKIQEQFSWITTVAQENVAGIRVVKAYNQEEAFIERFRQANDEYLQRSLSLVRVQGIFQPLLAFLLGLSLVGLLWYGGRQVVLGTITLGDFVAFMAYLAMLTWPTIALGFVINIFERGAASMRRINRLMDVQLDIEDRDVKHIDQIRGEIEVRNLTFSYNGAPVLKNVSFHVPAGNSLAIVGRTGSGKSTLVNLLCRLYPVPDGTIFIDGEEINRIPLNTLRKSIGYVPQDAFLFSETIRQNIAFGDPNAPEEKIREAAEISNILPDIESFPGGFKTFVGERGVTLSGGQKQRLSISRALLIRPRILILDDSLSAVDTQTEEQILERLSHQLKHCTAILISHRISTIKMADEIIVLDKGRIVERGSHTELLQHNGYYADLYQRQLLKEELEQDEAR